MTDFNWQNWCECDMNEQGRKVVEHPATSNQTRSRKDQEVDAAKQYTDSASVFNTEQKRTNGGAV